MNTLEILRNARPTTTTHFVMSQEYGAPLGRRGKHTQSNEEVYESRGTNAGGQAWQSRTSQVLNHHYSTISNEVPRTPYQWPQVNNYT
jgi:hypothetical protein